MADEADKKEYEIGFLLKNEEDFAALVNMLRQHEAEITYEGQLRRLSLAYEIKGESQAVFGYAHFRIDPSLVTALANDLKTSSPLLRSLVITPPFTKGRVPLAPKMMRPSAPAAVPRMPAPRSSPMPLSNEALEKKIEEILQ